MISRAILALLVAAWLSVSACSQAPVVGSGPLLAVTVAQRAPTCTTVSCPVSIEIRNLQRQRLAVTRTMYYEGSFVYLRIQRDDWIGVMPYPVPQEVELSEPLGFSCVPAWGTLSIELDLAAWRPTISGVQSNAAYCLVCGSSKVSLRAGYYDAGWPAKKPLYCSRPDGTYQSEELVLEILGE